MKVLNQKRGKVLGATEINFNTAIDFKKITFEEEFLVLPISAPSLIHDLDLVIYEAANEHDIFWVDAKKTKFEILIDPSSDDFNCYLNVVIFPLKFEECESKDYVEPFAVELDKDEVRSLLWITLGYVVLQYDIAVGAASLI